MPPCWHSGIAAAVQSNNTDYIINASFTRHSCINEKKRTVNSLGMSEGERAAKQGGGPMHSNVSARARWGANWELCQ